jgi:hypothetical protein
LAHANIFLTKRPILAVKVRCLLKRVGDAVEGGRLPLPAGIVSEPVIRQVAGPAHDGEVALDLGVPALGLFDEPAHRGLIEHLPHGHRPTSLDNVKQGLAASLDLGLGGTVPFSLINRRAAAGASATPAPEYF